MVALDGFADADELQRYRYGDGAVFLGDIHPDHGLAFEAGLHDDRHLFLFAGSRAGKGTSVIVPNLLRWRGPVFCIDPKGENASITAMRRGSVAAARGSGTSVRPPWFLGQKVAILDPFSQVEGPARRFQVAYNPLDDIDMRRRGGVKDIRALVSSVVVPETGAGAHFSESAETLLAGILEYVMLVEPPQARTLRRCAQIALLGHEALAETLRACNTPAGLAARALALLDDVGTDELGSFKSTLSRNLKWLDDPSMQTHLRGEGFSLRRIVQEGGSVYVCLPADEMADFRNWLRIVVRIALDAKQALGTRQSGLQTLFLLDEFPVLGTFPLIEQSAGYMAGYGIKLAPVIQNLGQIKNLYAKNWETFLGNAGGILGWGLNDAETETYLADRMGKILRWEYTVNDSRNAGQSSGRGGGSESSGWSRAVNHALQERVLRYASEVHIEAARHTGRAFVLPADGAPFAVLRRNYFEERDRRWYDDPEFLAKWEMGYAARAANA